MSAATTIGDEVRYDDTDTNSEVETDEEQHGEKENVVYKDLTFVEVATFETTK